MTDKQPKIKILFLCTGNSCRSQMAEGFVRHLKHETLEAYSAGMEKRVLDPRAVAVMAEVGVDITEHRSKLIDEMTSIGFDYVITVCDHARESCPLFMGDALLVHVGFEDPPALAADETDEERRLGHYRRVRDQIRVFVDSLPGSLPEVPGESHGPDDHAGH
jgi:arsenate reductase (thioredoxin)